MTNRVMVIGGSGFTGQRVVAQLLGRGHDVLALARSGIASDQLTKLGARPVDGDLDHTASVRRAMSDAKADRLVVVASLGFGHGPSLVDAASEIGFGHCVFVSTTAIFTTLDASTKATRIAAEDAIRSSSLSWTIIRPTMIYGAPGDRNMEKLVRYLRRTPVIPLPNGGRNLQQPVHVSDLARTICNASEAGHGANTAYNVPGPEPITFADVVHSTASALQRQRHVVAVPAKPIRWAVSLQEHIVHRPRLKAEQIDRITEDKCFDTAQARRDLDHRPRPFLEGIREEVRELEQVRKG